MTRKEAIVIARAVRVANAPSLHERFWSKVNRLGINECWPWMAAVRRPDEGYGAFYLNGRHQPSNRVAWMLTNGPIPQGLVVCHRCDNPPCCNPAHLFLGTKLDNDKDRIAKGRQCRGSQQKYAVCTENDVKRLRELKQQIGLKAAAAMMGIKYSTAYDMCTRSWRHVK